MIRVDLRVTFARLIITHVLLVFITRFLARAQLHLVRSFGAEKHRFPMLVDRPYALHMRSREPPRRPTHRHRAYHRTQFNWSLMTPPLPGSEFPGKTTHIWIQNKSEVLVLIPCHAQLSLSSQLCVQSLLLAWVLPKMTTGVVEEDGGRVVVVFVMCAVVFPSTQAVFFPLDMLCDALSKLHKGRMYTPKRRRTVRVEEGCRSCLRLLWPETTHS